MSSDAKFISIISEFIDLLFVCLTPHSSTSVWYKMQKPSYYVEVFLKKLSRMLLNICSLFIHLSLHFLNALVKLSDEFLSG